MFDQKMWKCKSTPMLMMKKSHWMLLFSFSYASINWLAFLFSITGNYFDSSSTDAEICKPTQLSISNFDTIQFVSLNERKKQQLKLKWKQIVLFKWKQFDQISQMRNYVWCLINHQCILFVQVRALRSIFNTFLLSIIIEWMWLPCTIMSE